MPLAARRKLSPGRPAHIFSWKRREAGPRLKSSGASSRARRSIRAVRLEEAEREEARPEDKG